MGALVASAQGAARRRADDGAAGGGGSTLLAALHKQTNAEFKRGEPGRRLLAQD